jgi:hypothetical protein
MRLQQALESVAGFATAAQFDHLREHIDPAWIEEALEATGTATVRRRRLPADQVLWIVLGMALFRNESIERIVASLDLALPATGFDLVAKSAIAKARQRLGSEPLAYLFEATASEWATRSALEHRWCGLSLYAMDGTTFRVPDSPENRAQFGGQSAGGERGDSGYPSARMVALVALRSHLVAALRIGAYRTGETTLARDLWSEMPNKSLLIVDRGFLIAAALTQLGANGMQRYWLTRAKSRTKVTTIKKLGRSDALVEIELSRRTRAKNPGLPEHWIARAITYHRKGSPPAMLLTSLLDCDRFPAADLVTLYHERWEVELAYDEIKTHMLERHETIRSRKPDGVLQELWGLALAYNLVRLEMERVANEAGVEPTRISFTNALALVRNAWLWCSAPPPAPAKIPAHLADLRRALKLLVLPPRRPRTYPRAVKLKMSNYPRKRPGK